MKGLWTYRCMQKDNHRIFHHLLLGPSVQSWQQFPTMSGVQQLLKSRNRKFETTQAWSSSLPLLAHFQTCVLEAAKLEPQHRISCHLILFQAIQADLMWHSPRQLLCTRHIKVCTSYRALELLRMHPSAGARTCQQQAQLERSPW